MAKKKDWKKTTIVITLEGKDEGDLETALDQVVSSVREGYSSGGDGNETGCYYFDVQGDLLGC